MTVISQKPIFQWNHLVIRIYLLFSTSLRITFRICPAVRKEKAEEAYRTLVEKDSALEEQRKQMEVLKQELEKYKKNAN